MHGHYALVSQFCVCVVRLNDVYIFYLLFQCSFYSLTLSDCTPLWLWTKQGLKFLEKILNRLLIKFLKRIRAQFWSYVIDQMVSVWLLIIFWECRIIWIITCLSIIWISNNSFLVIHSLASFWGLIMLY